MIKHARSTKGNGNLQFLAYLLIFGLVCYGGFKMLYPYYAYKSIERTMQHWANVAIHRGDKDLTEMREKIKWMIDRHKIPLDPDEVEVEYSPEEKLLTVYAEYDVYVEFPGYTHHYHFEPYAEAVAEGS